MSKLGLTVLKMSPNRRHPQNTHPHTHTHTHTHSDCARVLPADSHALHCKRRGRRYRRPAQVRGSFLVFFFFYFLVNLDAFPGRFFFSFQCLFAEAQVRGSFFLPSISQPTLTHSPEYFSVSSVSLLGRSTDDWRGTDDALLLALLHFSVCSVGSLLRRSTDDWASAQPGACFTYFTYTRRAKADGYSVRAPRQTLSALSWRVL